MVGSAGLSFASARNRVLAVAPNPALDRVSLAFGARRGGTVRASEYLDTAGGKAVHVALVTAALGAPTTLVAPLGGRRGERVRALLTGEPVELVLVEISGETRGTYSIVDQDDGDVLEVIEPSPTLTPEEVGRLRQAVDRTSRAAAVVVGSGSLPGGVPTDFYAHVARTARERGALVLLDASGKALAAALGARPDLVKPNLTEAVAFLGCRAPLENAPLRELVELACAFRSKGARNAWLTLGARGSLLATSAGDVWHLSLSAPRAVSAVGCGDALLGGLAAALAEGRSLLEAARLGVAAAVDKLANLHPGRVRRASVRALVPRVAVERVA